MEESALNSICILTSFARISCGALPFLGLNNASLKFPGLRSSEGERVLRRKDLAEKREERGRISRNRTNRMISACQRAANLQSVEP